MSDVVAGRSCLPPTAVLEMTYRCNHRCLYCSCPWEAENGSFSREPELTVEQWRVVLEELTTRHDCSQLAFTGGEALLKEGLADLIEYASALEARHPVIEGDRVRFEEKAPELYVLTNGRSLDERWLRLFARHGVRLSLSLPGLETFERHTGFDGARNVLRRIARARELGVIVTVNVTVTRLNLHELFETLSQAFLHGAHQLLMNRFMPGGRGLSHLDELVLDADDVLTMCEVADEVLTLSDRPGSLGTELPLCVLKGRRFAKLQVGTRCSAAKEFFVIGPSGYIRVCNHSPVRVEHISNVSRLATHPYWRKFVARDYLPDPCFACSKFTQCDGGCREAAHVLAGSVSAPDPLWHPDMAFRGSS